MRLLIVDDHLAMAEALAAYLSREHEVLAVLNDHTQVLLWLAEHPVDLILLGGSLPGCNLYELIRRIAFRKLRVVVMTMYAPTTRWPALRRMGAWGTLSKSSSLKEFTAELNRLRTLEHRPADGDRTLAIPEPKSRELEVLLAMARGLHTKQIAADIALSESRAEEHIAGVLELLDAKSWTHAVVRAIEFGWI
jgi:DNA-binding NarL/FixJ family response regulator